MTCSCTTNTYLKDYNAIKWSILTIAWSMSANWIPIDLPWYEFKLEISLKSDFVTPAMADLIGTIVWNSYSFPILLNIDPWMYVYRVTYKDSLGRLNPEALRYGKLIITE